MFSLISRRPLTGALALLAVLAPANGQSWQQTLTGQTTSEYDRFGSSLACNSEVLFIGCPRDNTTGVIRGTGSVTVFTQESAGWTEGELLLPSAGVLDGNFGTSLSLDGTRLLVGAPGEDSLAAVSTGLVHVIEQGAATWSRTGSLEVSDLAPGDRFGYAVALDGEWAAVGAPGRDHSGWNDGCVFIFQNTATGWVESGRLFPPANSFGSRFGHSLALRGDTLVVGAPEDSSSELASGAAYVFTRGAQGEWSMTTELIARGLGALQRFGVTVAFGASTIAVGAPGSYAPFSDAMAPQSTTPPEPPRGDVWVFRDTGAGWTGSQRLRAPAGDRGDLFGQRMHLAEGRLSVSSGGRPTGGGHKGATFLYEESGSGWFLTQEISDPSPSAGPLFGAVAVHASDTLFVSGVFDGAHGTDSGCVQVFNIAGQGHQFCFGELCPCGNHDPTAGCVNATGAGAEIFALGSASVTEDDLVIGVQGLPAGTPTLVFISTTENQAFFGNGLLCVGSGALSRSARLGRVRLASSAGEVRWGPGILSTPGMAATSELLYLQAIYRDPNGVCGAGINLSNALGFELIP